VLLSLPLVPAKLIELRLPDEKDGTMKKYDFIILEEIEDI
jgi:hypothetical protein